MVTPVTSTEKDEGILLFLLWVLVDVLGSMKKDNAIWLPMCIWCTFFVVKSFDLMNVPACLFVGKGVISSSRFKNISV